MSQSYHHSWLLLYSKRVPLAAACCVTMLIGACGDDNRSHPAMGDSGAAPRGAAITPRGSETRLGDFEITVGHLCSAVCATHSRHHLPGRFPRIQ
jgi:hypothetical protein